MAHLEQKQKIFSSKFKNERLQCYGQPVKSDIRTYDNIRKISTGQGDDYTTGC